MGDSYYGGVGASGTDEDICLPSAGASRQRLAFSLRQRRHMGAPHGRGGRTSAAMRPFPWRMTRSRREGGVK